MKKFLKWTGILLLGTLALLMLAGVLLYPVGVKKLTQTYLGISVESLNLPTEAEAVARGAHIAVIWQCTKCHGDDLSGKLVSNDSLIGVIPASNLTAGEDGIGSSYSDADWVRAIRHGVKPDGSVEVLMEPYLSTMSDQDLGDLIAYLKQLTPVDTNHPARKYGLLFPIASAAGLLTPAAEKIDHAAIQPATVTPGANLEYGAYLWPLCTECHSSNLATSLNKDSWTQDDFIRAMQTGTLPDGEQIGQAMRKKAFSELSDMELTALWRYMNSLSQQTSGK